MDYQKFEQEGDLQFNHDQINALSEMLNPGGNDDEGHVFGSALNPHSLHGGKTDKEMAKPHVKMETVVNNRNKTGGAVLSEEQ